MLETNETYASPFVAAGETEVRQQSAAKGPCQCVRCQPVEETNPAEAEIATESAAGETLGETESESFEADPYSQIRPAMSPEHANLSTEEVTLLLGGAPARMVLHRLLNSPAAQQVALASLLGNGARQSVRLDGSDISVPGFLRVMSRLSREVAEEFDTPRTAPPKVPRGILKYDDDVSRTVFYTLFKSAIQGTAGRAKLSAAHKATLAEAVADAGVLASRSHREQIDCAMAAVTGSDSKDQLARVLNLSGAWGDAFNGALQATSGDNSRTAKQAVQDAVDIADQAVLASGHLDDSLWSTYMKCKRR